MILRSRQKRALRRTLHSFYSIFACDALTHAMCSRLVHVCIVCLCDSVPCNKYSSKTLSNIYLLIPKRIYLLTSISMNKYRSLCCYMYACIIASMCCFHLQSTHSLHNCRSNEINFMDCSTSEHLKVLCRIFDACKYIWQAQEKCRIC